MKGFSFLGLTAVLMALIQVTNAFQVQISQVLCSRLYFTLTLTPAEAQVATGLNIYNGTDDSNEIASIAFDRVYATTASYQWYTLFESSANITEGPADLTFELASGPQVDTELTQFAPATLPVVFPNCDTGAVNTNAASTSAGPTATSTGRGSSSTGSSSNKGNNSNNSSNNGSDASNSSSSSGSSSSTGAIAGGVVGGIAAVLVAALAFFCLRRKKRNARNQQSRLRNDEADEAAFRAPNNNDSTASLHLGNENVNTPMMRDISTKNVFADPTSSGVSGAPSGSTSQLNKSTSPGSSVAAGGAVAAAAGGIGAAAVAARKQSREQSRARSPSQASDRSPTSEFSNDKATPSSQLPPPVPALPASTASQPVQRMSSPPSATTTATNTAPAAKDSNEPVAAGAAAAAAKAGDKDNKNKNKNSKWGFKRASKDMTASPSKPPYPSAVPEPIAVPESSSDETSPPASLPSPTKKSAEVPASPTRSFNVIQKQPVAAAASTAGPSSASIAPSETSLNRAPVYPSRSGPGTPAGSIRGNNYSRAPSVASMSTPGFADAPPLPSGAASVASQPTSEFGGNMAGIGAGRSFAASSGNSTKWHQQAYNVMPNFSHRALARSTQLDEDLIFGHLGMGLSPPPGPAGNGSETGSSKSRTDPFGDR